jgi:peptidoglycan biosynthesis protein MviN/MurJ (putative lipid II flippase)
MEIGLAAVFGAAIATTVALLFRPISVVLLAHGSFRADDASRIGVLVEMYGGFIFLNAVAWAAEAALYARGHVWRVVSLSITPLALNIALSLLLIHRIGEPARPIAATAAMALYAPLLLLALARQEGICWRSYVPIRRVTVVALGTLAVDGLLMVVIRTLVGSVSAASAMLLFMVSAGAALAYVRHWLGSRPALAKP